MPDCRPVVKGRGANRVQMYTRLLPFVHLIFTSFATHKFYGVGGRCSLGWELAETLRATVPALAARAACGAVSSPAGGRELCLWYFLGMMPQTSLFCC